MCEYDWLLTAQTYGLIGCSRAKLSDLTNINLYSDRPNQTVKQPIKIKQFMPLANKHKLPSPP